MPTDSENRRRKKLTAASIIVKIYALKHKEIPIKVNAWVDEGVAPLVSALNEFPGIATISSCRGHDGIGYVRFLHLGPDAALFRFVQNLSRSLGSMFRADYFYSIRLNWTSGGDRPSAELHVRSDKAEHLAGAIKRVAIDACRRTGFRRGNHNTKPRSYSKYRVHQQHQR
jgi:hypothetical protein